MRLERLQRHWDEFGRTDPYWAILTDPAKKGNKWDLDEFFKTGEREVDDVLAWVESLGVATRRGRALDFGCGAGRISQALGRHFEHVIGVDIAPSMVALANQHNRHGERCRYVLNEHADLRQFQDSSVDFIYSRLVLQHLRPKVIKAYVAEFVRLLDVGGVAVFNVPAAPLDTPLRLATPTAARSIRVQLAINMPSVSISAVSLTGRSTPNRFLNSNFANSAYTSTLSRSTVRPFPWWYSSLRRR